MSIEAILDESLADLAVATGHVFSPSLTEFPPDQLLNLRKVEDANPGLLVEKIISTLNLMQLVDGQGFVANTDLQQLMRLGDDLSVPEKSAASTKLSRLKGRVNVQTRWVRKSLRIEIGDAAKMLLKILEERGDYTVVVPLAVLSKNGLQVDP